MWTFVSENWHKFLVVIIALIQGVQYVASKFGSKTEKQSITVQLPEKGCTITVKPLD